LQLAARFFAARGRLAVLVDAGQWIDSVAAFAVEPPDRQRRLGATGHILLDALAYSNATTVFGNGHQLVFALQEVANDRLALGGQRLALLDG
jgi:hypothetical protein